VVEQILAKNSLCQRIRTIRDGFAQVPIVLITEFCRANAALLGSVEVDCVIWSDELSHHLPVALERLTKYGPRQGVVAAVSNSTLPRAMRSLIAEALQRDPPPRSVMELARISMYSVSTLERHWKESIGTRNGFRVKQFLDFAIALRAAELLPNTKTVSAATYLGVDRRTLERALKRAGGWTPATLRRVSPYRIGRMLTARLISESPS
jgi:hypothetical protein